jgi:hypothetical protein
LGSGLSAGGAVEETGNVAIAVQALQVEDVRGLDSAKPTSGRAFGTVKQARGERARTERPEGFGACGVAANVAIELPRGLRLGGLALRFEDWTGVLLAHGRSLSRRMLVGLVDALRRRSRP